MYLRHSVAPETSRGRSAFAEDVAYYLSLTPRQLPSRYLYDDLGSALFEAICHLPWYHIARTEQHLLAVHAHAIVAQMEPLARLVELGPGSGDKLATLIDAFTDGCARTVHLVDVSETSLNTAAQLLRPRAHLSVVLHQATYEAGLLEIGASAQSTGRTLALFLGSNIGNFDPPGADAFLRTFRASLAVGDALLLGTDLVRSEQDLSAAYDDPLGVTAAFNRNLLIRANRELGADFDLDGFAHRAIWNAEASRIEMHLFSERRQRVRIPASHLDITFEPGESIWTESSYKYHPNGVVDMLNRSGFSTVEQWTEDHFALTLAEAH